MSEQNPDVCLFEAAITIAKEITLQNGNHDLHFFQNLIACRLGAGMEA